MRKTQTAPKTNLKEVWEERGRFSGIGTIAVIVYEAKENNPKNPDGTMHYRITKTYANFTGIIVYEGGDERTANAMFIGSIVQQIQEEA